MIDAQTRPEDHAWLVPVRMVNEWVYCPRLAYLMWVEGEWGDSADTVQGRRIHKRVDKASGTLAHSEDDKPDQLQQARSMMLSSERLGIIAKMDVIESRSDMTATPVEFKKGKRPHLPKQAFEPERVQVCAQAMILEDNGYTVNEGGIWFAGSRERVRIVLDEELRELTLKSIKGLREAARLKRRPPPLIDSPKCPRCSLAGICLPDETHLLQNDGKNSIRPLNPAYDSALPLYIQTPGARLKKSGGRLIIEHKDGDTVKKLKEIPLIKVSQVALFGPITVTTPALHALMRQDIPLAYFSMGGWFLGQTNGVGNGNVAVREAQYRTAFNPKASFKFAQSLVAAKIQNSRTFLRRNWRQDKAMHNDKDESAKKAVLKKMQILIHKSSQTQAVQELLGIEGEAAACYFANFDNMLAQNSRNGFHFSFQTRSRRPPTDPVNALLSLGYALLTRVFSSSIAITGLDPHMGLYHRPQHGRPSLALDLMEPYRAIIADSCVIQVINNSEIKPKDFITNGKACSLKNSGRKAFIRSFERRLEQEVTHPIFGYRISMRRLIDVQIRLLSRYLQNEMLTYPHYLPR